MEPQGRAILPWKVLSMNEHHVRTPDEEGFALISGCLRILRDARESKATWYIVFGIEATRINFFSLKRRQNP